ncbi:MAG: phosphoglucosamine mutase [Dehalococcoidia bacterium]
MNMGLFGTSGIRGVVNQDLTPELCKKVGSALGTLLPAGATVCLGMDTRLSREMIRAAVTEGLLGAGINVAQAGIVPTPALALLTREMNFDAGVMITASHNPPEFNGIKLFNHDAIGYGPSQEEEVEKAYYSGSFRTARAGSVTHFPHMKDRYIEFIKSLVSGWDFNLDLKLLIDPGNGAAAGLAGDIFKQLGFTVLTINDMPDGRFPGRSPEPKEDTLQGTIKFLRQKNADLAICFDGDADRVVFCDQTGFLGFNEMIAFIARAAIKSSGKQLIATTVESGMLLDMAIKDLGGKVVRGRVGDVFAAHLAQDNNAALGVESVGVYILPQAGYYPESIFAALTLLRSIKRVSDIRSFLSTLPPLFFLKDKISCINEKKAEVMARVMQQSNKLGAASLNDLDGLRFELAEGWMLIRASGTEPAIRILAEGNSEQHARSLLNMGLTVLKDAARGSA